MSLNSLNENSFLERFVSQEHINCNDHHFWHQLLSCSFNFMRAQDARLVEKALEPYLVRLALNNDKSLNTGSLVRVFLDRVGKIKYQQNASSNLYYLFQAFNALYLLRCICKQFVENSTSEEKLVQNFMSKSSITINNKSTPLMNNGSQSTPATNNIQPPITNSSGSSSNPTNQSIVADNDKSDFQQQQPTVHVMTGPTVSSSKRDIVSGNTTLEQFMTALIEIIVDIPLSDSTYQLHVESINTLIILLSIQMYQPQPLKKSIIYRCLMQKKCSIHSLLLIKTLLFNFIKQLPMPQESGSIIFGLASGLWNVLTLGYGRGSTADELANGPILARQSLFLLNILTNHCTTDKNPYREAIISCQDSRLSALGDSHHHTIGNFSSPSASSQPMAIVNSIKIDFSTLYETVCKLLDNDQVALLLYLLLHRNYTFKSYVMSVSSGLSKLVLPLLKVLYTSMEKGSHHVYMVLIILLILSEEPIFNEAIHEINVKTVTWYMDRNLNDISLACLATLIVIRSIQYNIFRMKDKFLHTNLFAMLANLSNHFKNLDPYVCQRLMDVLERLVKRYSMSGPAKMISIDCENNVENKTSDESIQMEKLNETTEVIPMMSQQSSSIEIPAAAQDSTENGGKTLPAIVDNENTNSNNTNDQVGIQIDDTSNDVLMYEDVIRMLLEVTNNCLVVQLRDNPDLIYTLLYKKALFDTLKTFEAFHAMVINIEKVLTFFYNRIEESHQEKTLTVSEIKYIISSSSREWPLKNSKVSGISKMLITSQAMFAFIHKFLMCLTWFYVTHLFYLLIRYQQA